MSTRKQARIIALFLTALVLLAAAKVRMAEAPRPGEELRTCQYAVDSVAAIPYQLVLPAYGTAGYLPLPGGETPRQSPTPFSPPYRGPPAQFSSFGPRYGSL